MRLPILAALLALLPMPALADVTARYSAGKTELVVESDDGGNARITVAGKFGIIRRDGSDYVVVTTPTGETKVAALAELLAMMSGAMTARTKSAAPSGLAIEKFVLLAKGEATVGERKGSLWSFGPDKEQDGRPGKMLDVVISADPALAPIAAVFRRTLESLLPVLGAVIPEASGFAPKALELIGKGAPLRIDKLVELQSVATTEIDPKRFDLPAPVITAMEFLSAMSPGETGEGFLPLP
ncbi:hypothetical protein [Sphingomonas sp.]|uniref:hypothetical protein n=1 Tax=Sphingomonas sp. TaxID=28214 RepID=UPI002ED9080E